MGRVRGTGRDDALGLGLTMAHRGITLGLEFALPALGGFALDRRWGTHPALTLLGATLGFVAGLYHLLRISRPAPRPGGPDATKPGPQR